MPMSCRNDTTGELSSQILLSENHDRSNVWQHKRLSTNNQKSRNNQTQATASPWKQREQLCNHCRPCGEQTSVCKERKGNQTNGKEITSAVEENTRDVCVQMGRMPHERKIGFLKENGICFGCFCTGHISKDKGFPAQGVALNIPLYFSRNLLMILSKRRGGKSCMLTTH